MSDDRQTRLAQREAIRQRVRRVHEITGLSYTSLAKRAGIGAASTLTRFMNDPRTTHLLSTTTLAKIESVGDLVPAERDDPKLLKALGDRMRLVREIIAPSYSDEAIASLIGWTPKAMQEIFDGNVAPTVTALRAFAQRMRVTTDFLLSESLEGLPRFAERKLLAARPGLGEPPGGIESHTGTDPT